MGIDKGAGQDGKNAATIKSIDKDHFPYKFEADYPRFLKTHPFKVKNNAISAAQLLNILKSTPDSAVAKEILKSIEALPVGISQKQWEDSFNINFPFDERWDGLSLYIYPFCMMQEGDGWSL